jgi:hypothetical protein
VYKCVILSYYVLVGFCYNFSGLLEIIDDTIKLSNLVNFIV